MRSYKKDVKHAICFLYKELDKEHAIVSTYMVVLKFASLKPNFHIIKSCIIQGWDLKRDFRMSLMDPKYVLFYFENYKELDLVLARNYWSS